MNSLFGMLGNRYAKEYFDIRVAEAITLSGQTSILWITKKLNEYFARVLKTGEIEHKVIRTGDETLLQTKGNGKPFVIYADTDSVYICLDDLVDKMFSPEVQRDDPEKIVNFLDNLFNKHIEPYINECYEELAEYLNAHEQRMFMKRETIAQSAIWTSKKHYALMANDVEGVRYKTPKLKFLGLEAKKSSTPKFCREWLEECYELALLDPSEGSMHKKVSEIRQQFMDKAVEEIAAPRTVNNLEKFMDSRTLYIKGTPGHVKAALNHNHLIDRLGLQQVKPISSGDKILFVELKQNPYNFDTLGFSGFLPVEFDMHKYVDYNKTFEKNFINALNNYLIAIGWKHEPVANVMDFFVD